MDHVQRCSVLSVFSCSKHLVPKVKFHGLARHAATKTVPEGTGARRGAGRGERVLGGSPFPLLLRALRVLCAKKILATMRDADGLQCRERGEKVLPKMQTSPTLQCKGAKIERITGYLTNDRRSVTWTGNGKIFFASLQCNNPNSLISDKTFSPRRTRRSRRQIDQKGLFNTSCPSCPSW